MTDALVLDNVTKRFGEHTAVDGVSAAFAPGRIYGFLGLNGAGKTTTLRMVMSILYPDEGRIAVLGDEMPERVKDRLGYLPEEKGLYKKMTAAEIVTYFGRLKGLDRTTAKTRSRELLERFGLGAWRDKRCEALSKGMGQKVQILATLIHEPELVILDEVFSGLDPVNTEMVRDVILDIKRSGRTVIFSTHVMEQAEQICDAILLLHKGRKVLDGPLAEIQARFGETVHIEYEGDGSVLRDLPGVERVNDAGRHAELSLRPGADPQALLPALVDRLVIRRFDLREPSLHEIFLRTVGEGASGDGEAADE